MRWQQEWSDVLFLHYAVSAVELASRLPRGLKLDTYQGQGWLSLVFFRLHVRPLGWPAVPGFSSLLELNVRTYVTCGDLPGIVFFRMYADNALAIAAARLLSPLRYQPAAMQSNACSEQRRHMVCRPSVGGELAVQFRVTGQAHAAVPGSLDDWLLERYRLFVPTAEGRLVSGEVDHSIWQIQNTEIIEARQSLLSRLGFGQCSFPNQSHYSPGVAATFGRFHAVPGRTNHQKRVSAAGLRPPARAAARCAAR